MVGISLMVVSLVLLLTSSAAWENKWKHFKLSTDQITLASTVLSDLIESDWVKNERSDALKGCVQVDDPPEKGKNNNGCPEGKIKQDKSVHSKYKNIKWNDRNVKDRFKPLCKLIFRRAELNAKTQKYDSVTITRRCSCAFVGPQLVITAAHCFTGPHDATPEIFNAMYVVPQYGIQENSERKHAEHTKKQAKIAVEWWLPVEWPPIENRGEYCDVAFIKTGKPIDNKDDVFKMMMPWKIGHVSQSYDFIKQNLYALGYPFEYFGGETAVDFAGTLVIQQFTDKNDVLRQVLALMGKDKRGAFIFSKETADKGMAEGGSGAPWVIKYDLPYNMRLHSGTWDPTRKGMFGLISTHCADEGCKYSTGPMFTPSLIEVAALIEKGPSAGRVTSPTQEGQRFEVVEFPLKAAAVSQTEIDAERLKSNANVSI